MSTSESSGSNGRAELPRIAFSVVEVAQMTGRSLTSVWNDIRTGALPAVPLGGRTLILKGDLDEFMASRRVVGCKPRTRRGPKKKSTGS